MTGAGGLRVTNYLYSAAPKDGTVIGTFSRSIPTIPLLTPPGTFDARKFTWLGSMSGETSLCLTGRTSAVKTWQDMLTKPSIMGGQAVGADSDVYARLYKNVLGAQIRIVSGYPGTTEITLAMERGEVDGICGLSWGTVKVSHPEWRKNKSVNFLLQAGLNDGSRSAGRSVRDGRGQGSREKADSLSALRPASDGTAVCGAARHPCRPQGSIDQGVQQHDEGP